MYLEPVSETEIKKLISSLKSNPPGYDMIGSAVLKWCVDSISEPLSYVCNMSLQEGLFPDELKIANVIPLYKCDDPKLFNNYRPVSVLPSVSKVFERIMYNRLVAYLNENKILFSYQFGFRKQHSTYMALMTLMDKLTTCLDNDEYVMEFFLIFQRLLIQWTTQFYFKNYLSMASEEMLCHGSRAIWKTDVSLLLIMVYYLKLKYYNVELLKAPFLAHFSF